VSVNDVTEEVMSEGKQERRDVHQ